jgi:hypothetical protein
MALQLPQEISPLLLVSMLAMLVMMPIKTSVSSQRVWGWDPYPRLPTQYTIPFSHSPEITYLLWNFPTWGQYIASCLQFGWS